MRLGLGLACYCQPTFRSAKGAFRPLTTRGTIRTVRRKALAEYFQIRGRTGIVGGAHRASHTVDVAMKLDIPNVLDL